MKILKIILILAIIIGLGFGAYTGYNWFKRWEAEKYSEISMLKFNQEMFLKKVTDLSETITHVVNETAKTTIIPKEDSTYEGLKNEVIELKKDETANKEEIEKLREQLSEQRKAFLESKDTMLIKVNGENILLYKDINDNWQPASEGIEKIIEHKNVSEIPIPIEEIEVKKRDWNIKAGGYYSFNKVYGIILSKGIINIKDYSLNASVLLNDFEDLKWAVGADIGYQLKDNLELGVGYNSNKEYYIKLQYSF